MALKKINELDKAEKLMLLKAVASRDVDKNTLDKDTLVAIEYSDYFQGLMVNASPGNEKMNIICLGSAVKAKNEVIENIIITDDSDNEALRLKAG